MGDSLAGARLVFDWFLKPDQIKVCKTHKSLQKSHCRASRRVENQSTIYVYHATSHDHGNVMLYVLMEHAFED